MPAQKGVPTLKTKPFQYARDNVLSSTSPFTQGPQEAKIWLQEAKGPSLSSEWVGTVPCHSSPGDPGSRLLPCQADRHAFPYISWANSKETICVSSAQRLLPWEPSPLGSACLQELAVVWGNFILYFKTF